MMNWNASVLDAIGYTLFHMTWVSAIVIFLIAFVLKMSRNLRPAGRSHLIFGGMISILASTLILFIYFLTEGNSDPQTIREAITLNGLDSNAIMAIEKHNGIKDWLLNNKSTLTIFWFAGACLILMKFLLANLYVAFIKNTATISTEVKYLSIIRSLTQKMNYSRSSIQFGFSTIIDSPMVVGVIKPMILFPVGLINHLSTEEVEAIFAHEIAHLVRKDHLINFLMVTLEMLYYFHPGIWWLNNQMKKHREEACDDKAVAIASTTTNYINTLIKIEEYTSVKHVPLALNANGQNHTNFYNRIKRLLNMEVKSKSIRSQVLILTSIVILAIFISNNMSANSPLPDQPKAEKIEIVIEEKSSHTHNAKRSQSAYDHVETDTIPSKSKSVTRIITKSDEEEVEVEIENGEITRMKIDGEEIPKEEFENHEKILKKYKGNGNVIIFDEEGTNGKFERFEFPDVDGEAFAFRFDDHGVKLGEDHIIRIDSLLKGKFNDSVFVFPFDGDFDFDFDWNQIEGGRFHQFPEGFELHTFPDELKIELKGLGDEIIDLEDFIEREYADGHRLKGHNEFEYFPHRKEERNLENIIGSQLNSDGFLIPDKENKVVLTGKYLKINGEKQPSNIWNKYKSIFEQETGVPLHKKSRLEFSIIGKETNKRYKAF